MGSASAAGLSETQAELFLISKLLVVVLKIINPVAGLAMAFLCAVVIRGGNSPFVVLLTSNCADAAGVVVPIPTACAMLVMVTTKKNKLANNFIWLFRVRPEVWGLVLFVTTCLQMIISSRVGQGIDGCKPIRRDFMIVC